MKAVTARLATFPPRFDGLQKELPRLLTTFDRLLICVNQVDRPPRFLLGDERIVTALPPKDLKAAGKFYFPMRSDELVYLIDDDIHYPADYARVMKAHLDRVGRRAIVAVHGVDCQPVASGAEFGRIRDFWGHHPLYGAPTVIGTGTLCSYGENLPPLDEMLAEGGVGVDALLARYCARQGIPLVGIPKRKNWLSPNGNSIASIWESYGMRNPPGQAKAMRDALDLRDTGGHRALLWRLNAPRILHPRAILWLMEKSARKLLGPVRRFMMGRRPILP